MKESETERERESASEGAHGSGSSLLLLVRKGKQRRERQLMTKSAWCVCSYVWLDDDTIVALVVPTEGGPRPTAPRFPIGPSHPGQRVCV